MARNGFTPREAVTQSIGNVTTLARVAVLWHDRTLKTPEEIEEQINAVRSLIDAATTLESDLCMLYSDR